MSNSVALTHPVPPTPSTTPASSRAPSEELQSTSRPLKRTYAFYLLPDSTMHQPNTATSSVLPSKSTGSSTIASPPSLPTNRRTRTKRIKGLPPTRSSQRIWDIKEKKRKQQLQPEPKETKPAKRRKI
ncbi:hypothetical protein FRC02_006157 [Tulasnella sp. 418]|nr:hypothetical protein FRC02_006157 [Tulasnella sp. 418]